MTEPPLTTSIDIAVVAVALFLIIIWLKQARAGLAVVGALVLGAAYVAARELGLQLTAWTFQGVLTVFVIALVVVLQTDLRRLFERVAVFGIGGPKERATSWDVDEISQTAFELAGQNCGALIVLSGRDPVERYIDGGEDLDGQVSPPLLMSLFDPSSPGHDGAVILKGSLVTQFAAHLPLSVNFRQIARRGTRHSAAVGLSEVTDALCIVVSEERGEVSVAHKGKLQRATTLDELEERVAAFLGQYSSDQAAPGRALAFVRRHWIDALSAVVLSFGLWQLFVAGSQAGRRTLMAPVLVDEIDPGYGLEAVEPAEVEVEFSGLRRDLYLLDPAAIQIRLDASGVTQGSHEFRLSPNWVRHPDDLTVDGMTPETVTVRVSAIEEETPDAQAPDE